MSCRVALLASGGGSNVQAILDYHAALGPAAPFTPVLVASNRAAAPVLDRARAAGVAAAFISAPDDGAALTALLESHGTTAIALAGYLRFVPREVTTRWRGAVLNVHPALLPKFGGAGMYGHHVHAAVLAAHATESGATVHFVDEEYDRGAAIARARVPVRVDDTAATLAARVLGAEHALYPRVLHAFALGLVAMGAAGQALVDRSVSQRPDIPPSPVTIEYVT